jgi:hypothetical protein
MILFSLISAHYCAQLLLEGLPIFVWASLLHFLLKIAYDLCMVRKKKNSVEQTKRTVRPTSSVASMANFSTTIKQRLQKRAHSSASVCFVEPKGRCEKKESQRLIGSPMHPFIRTMFLSLAIGTAGVLASMVYYIHIARATEQLLYQDASGRITAEIALGSVNGTFIGLIQDLEEQRTDAGGALPIPPKEYLRLRTEQSGVDYDLLNDIAFCESHWRMVQNKKSTAFGYFQILDGTEKLTPQYKKGLRKTDPYANIDMAISLLQKYGTEPWTESKPCWSNR